MYNRHMCKVKGILIILYAGSQYTKLFLVFITTGLVNILFDLCIMANVL